MPKPSAHRSPTPKSRRRRRKANGGLSRPLHACDRTRSLPKATALTAASSAPQRDEEDPFRVKDECLSHIHDITPRCRRTEVQAESLTSVRRQQTQATKPPRTTRRLTPAERRPSSACVAACALPDWPRTASSWPADRSQQLKSSLWMRVSCTFSCTSVCDCCATKACTLASS